MPAKAKKVTLFLGNGSLDGLVNISESDGWDLGGELFSCPRSNINELLNEDIINNRIGVYLLLSSRRVYVGQAIDLKVRTRQHLLDKDWWERIILLTSDRNGLNESYITYLESQLIQKAKECGTSDVDNKTKGNKNTLSRFDTQLLDQYLSEAYFVLELIGINVFKKGEKKNNTQSVLPPIVDSTKEQRELRAKGEVKTFLENNKIKLPKYFSYAKLQEKKNVFWINPDVSFLEKEWTLVLNNQRDRKIFILNVPSNTFECSLQKRPYVLRIRPDKPIYIDLNLDCESFIDIRSKASFKKYVIDEIDY